MLIVLSRRHQHAHLPVRQGLSLWAVFSHHLVHQGAASTALTEWRPYPRIVAHRVRNAGHWQSSSASLAGKKGGHFSSFPAI